MKGLFTAVFFGVLAAISPVFAQTMGQSIKKYSDGPLTWDDFIVREKLDSGYNVIPSFNSFWNEVPAKSGNLRFTKIDVTTCLDRSDSFVRREAMTEGNLKYVQTIFDLCQLYTRRCQAEIDTAGNYSATNLFQYYNRLIGNKIWELDEESGHGKDSIVVNRYSREFAAELAEFEKISRVPSFTASNWGWGMYVQMGGDFHTGKVADYLSPEFKFALGLEMAYRRSFFDFAVNLGGGKLRNNIEGEKYVWQKGDSFGDVGVKIGYSCFVLDNACWSLGPMVGFELGCLTNSYKPEDSDKELNDSFTAMRGIAGIDWRYKLSRSVNRNGVVGSYGHTSIYLKLYAGYASYGKSPVPDGVSINFAVGIDFMSWKLK